MAELQQGEAGLPGVRRIFQDWIAAAGDTLYKRKITDANIHDARRQLKKSRAALRLLRDAIGEAAYRRENAALRDAARPLGVARDSRVLIAAFDDLIQRDASATRSLQLDKFRRMLRKEQTAARRAITNALIDRQRKILREVGARSDRWSMRGAEWQVIGAGLERIYRGGKKKMQTAVRSGANEDLHDWRKRVKYLWHQLEILQATHPGLLRKLVRQANRLADLLGDDHDLAVLRQKITDHAEMFESRDHDALIAVLDRRRKQLQSKAFKLGARLYAEKPSRFSSRVKRRASTE